MVIKRQDATAWASDAADFGDFVWVPPGFRGDVTISGPRGLTVAVYELDASEPPAGVGEGANVFREEVAGLKLAGATVGEPGQASLEVPFHADRAMVSLAGFSALQLRDQLQKFGQSARNLGLGVDEICEAIIQTAPYSGYAPALNALRWLGEVVQEG